MRDGVCRRRNFRAADHHKGACKLTLPTRAGNHHRECAVESEAATRCKASQAASTTTGITSGDSPLKDWEWQSLPHKAGRKFTGQQQLSAECRIAPVVTVMNAGPTDKLAAPASSRFAFLVFLNSHEVNNKGKPKKTAW